MLPPTWAVSLPHIIRANSFTMLDKSYFIDCPELLLIEENGWNPLESGCHIPVKCLALPAPKSVLALIKCGCNLKLVVKVGVAAQSIPCLAHHSARAAVETVQIL